MQELFSRARRWARHYGDWLLAGVLSVTVTLELALGSQITASPWINYPAALIVTGSLAWRRRTPTAVAVAVLAAMGLQAVLGGDLIENPASPIIALMVAFWSVGMYSSERRALWTLLGGFVVVPVVDIAQDTTSPGDFLFPPLVFMALPWLVGRMIRSRQQRLAALEQVNVQLDREREQHAELAVADERARIARELHDIVAHSVSVMVVQAGAARKIMDRDQDRAKQALEQVEQSGRTALTEMRRLLGVLRDQGEGAALAPQPGMARFDELVERARSAGLDIDVQVEGDPRPLPAAVDLSAYRLVQEALTNTIKYAGSAHADVLVRYGERDLELEVCDDGPGAVNGRGGGHGLIGMEHRVRSVCRGEFEAGNRPEGGFRVRATMPLDQVQA